MLARFLAHDANAQQADALSEIIAFNLHAYESGNFAMMNEVDAKPLTIKVQGERGFLPGLSAKAWPF